MENANENGAVRKLSQNGAFWKRKDLNLTLRRF